MALAFCIFQYTVHVPTHIKISNDYTIQVSPSTLEYGLVAYQTNTSQILNIKYVGNNDTVFLYYSYIDGNLYDEHLVISSTLLNGTPINRGQTLIEQFYIYANTTAGDYDFNLNIGTM